MEVLSRLGAAVEGSHRRLMPIKLPVDPSLAGVSFPHAQLMCPPLLLLHNLLIPSPEVALEKMRREEDNHMCLVATMWFPTTIQQVLARSLPRISTMTTPRQGFDLAWEKKTVYY
jgi:hypothetical protein